MLEIKDLHASVDGNEILKGISLSIQKGEIHAVMGPNGSGKSTLAKLLSGHPSYEATGGEVLFEGKNLFEMDAEERSLSGIFMGFQYPVEVPGVNNAEFLRMAFNARRVRADEEEIDPLDFDELLSGQMKMLKWKTSTRKEASMMVFPEERKRKMKFCRWRFLNLNLPSWMKPIPGSISMP